MCIAALAWQAHPRWVAVLASNRDEFIERPTEPMHAWATPGGTPIWAGRDVRAGGTWLAVAAQRLALVTNLRAPAPIAEGTPSRGGLPLAWLDGHPLPAAQQWNLLTANWQTGEAALHSSALAAALPVAAGGITTLSNGQPPALWPKQRRLAGFVQTALAARDVAALTARLQDALADRQVPPPESWPHTGVAPEVEGWLAPIHVAAPDGRYGTRCASVVVVERLATGALALHLTERRFATDGTVSGEVTWQGMPA
ncbi:MAG: NRDE family protein [Proteobacteria bacterium]|nr:NRDE family protein [Pseudomonadota bacterium]